MKSLLAAVAITAAMMTHVWAQENRCMTLGDFLQQAGDAYGEQIMWVSTDERASYVVLRNPETGSWTLAAHGNGMACVVASGHTSLIEPPRDAETGDPV